MSTGWSMSSQETSLLKVERTSVFSESRSIPLTLLDYVNRFDWLKAYVNRMVKFRAMLDTGVSAISMVRTISINDITKKQKQNKSKQKKREEMLCLEYENTRDASISAHGDSFSRHQRFLATPACLLTYPGRARKRDMTYWREITLKDFFFPKQIGFKLMEGIAGCLSELLLFQFVEGRLYTMLLLNVVYNFLRP